ncbi:Uncharacterized protein FWK35_00024415, partial [Aphis craccivora]
KHLILTNVWVQPSNYKFPLSEKKTKNVNITGCHILNLKNGAFCKYCVIFSKTGGINSQPLRQLVVKALN